MASYRNIIENGFVEIDKYQYYTYQLRWESGFVNFKDTLTLVDELDSGEIATSVIISKIKEDEAWTHEDYELLHIFDDERKSANFEKYSKNNLMFEFWEIRERVLIVKKKKESIGITFYPKSQTIPKKFFPMNGKEDIPYVAFQLNLKDKQG